MRNSSLLILIMIVLASCSSDSKVEPGGDAGGYDEIISVSCQPRKAAVGIDDEESGTDAESIIIDGFDVNSRLYFSQMGNSTPPNFDNQDPDAFPYLYIYGYYPNTEATWEKDYNFKAVTGRQSFDWDLVKALGSVGNAFSFYAFYFPVDNRIRFNVERDQTGGPQDQYSKENFMKSDIMGAYHATSSLYTRMRFNLWHLMTYLKVTVYVPVFKNEQDNDGNVSISGFGPGAMLGAYVYDAYSEFDIEWYANRSSDTQAPAVQAKGSKGNIKMYAHKPDETNIKYDLSLTPFYPKNGSDNNESFDDVREYTFSVLFPTQAFGDKEFLYFALKSPADKIRYYSFASPLAVNNEVGDAFSLTQGTLQHLYLYLPRVTNEAILIGAKILPWQNAVTDMTVIKNQESGN